MKVSPEPEGRGSSHSQRGRVPERIASIALTVRMVKRIVKCQGRSVLFVKSATNAAASRQTILTYRGPG